MVVMIDGFSFERELADALRGHERAAYVSLYGAPFYDRCACFAAVRGGRIRALAAITTEGELISVLRTAWGNGKDVDEVLTRALDTGSVRYLECYDGKLPALCTQYGFTVAERYTFDDNAAAPTWNYTRDGRPDYLRMAYIGVKAA